MNIKTTYKLQVINYIKLYYTWVKVKNISFLFKKTETNFLKVTTTAAIDSYFN